jgi:hypothetical protein
MRVLAPAVSTQTPRRAKWSLVKKTSSTTSQRTPAIANVGHVNADQGDMATMIMSSEALTESVVQASIRRSACQCPNCRDGYNRYEHRL